MKKIFFKTEPFQISSDSKEQALVILKIFIFDFESQKVFFSFKVKNNMPENSQMKKNFLDIHVMSESYEMENSYFIENKKAERILSQRINNLNGHFLNDFCRFNNLEELLM